jgi:hypothetical protein
VSKEIADKALRESALENNGEEMLVSALRRLVKS